MRATGWGTGRPICRAWEFKTSPTRFIYPIFASTACRPFISLLPEEILAKFRTVCRLRTWFWDGFRLGFWFETQGFTSSGHLLSSPCVSGLFSFISRRLGFRVCGCIFLSAFIPCLDSFFTSFNSLMAPQRETSTSKAQSKRLIEPSQSEQTEACRKARFDMALFSSNEDYQRYKEKFAQRKVIPGRSVNFSQLQHFGFEGLFGRMGWLPVVTISEPIFPTLVRAFYSRATYEVRGPVLSLVRGVEIRLSPESICRILDIPSVGLRVYEAKAWPTVPGFEPREAV